MSVGDTSRRADPQLDDFIRWLRELVEACRDIDPGAGTGPIFRFQPPCQIDILHMAHDYHRLDYRFCVVTHMDTAPDMEVRVHGPFLPHELAAGIEAFLEDARWDEPIPGGSGRGWMSSGGSTYGEALKAHIGNAYTGAQVYLNNTVRSPGIVGPSMGMITLPGGGFSWGIAGKIEETWPDPRAYAISVIEGNRMVSQASAGPPREPPPERGLGSFLIPGVWVGEAPVLSLAARLENVSPESVAHLQEALRFTLRGQTLAVTRSGFFALGEEDRERAADVLNSLFATFLFAGIPTSSVAPTDLVMSSDVKAPLWSYSTEDVVHHEQLDRLSGQRLWFAYDDSRTIPASLIDTALEEAAGWLDSQWDLPRKFTLDASTFLRRGEHRNATLAAWTAIELALSTEWRAELAAGNATRAVRKRLAGWDISRIIDHLNHVGLVTAEELGDLNWLRQTRNALLHRGAPISGADAERAVTLALSTVRDWPARVAARRR